MDVIVRFRRAPGAAEKLLVQGFGGSERRRLRTASRWMSLRLPANVVARLADNPNVEFVASDPPMSLSMDVAKAASNAAPVEVPESAYKGAGVTIAMIDSGVAAHPDIQTLVASADFVDGVPVVPPPIPEGPIPNPNPALSVDPYGHGTHVAGILVGNGSHSTDAKMAGIAPQANLVSVRVIDATGHGQASDVLAGLQWVLDHKTEYGIRVVNLSLGHPISETLDTDPLVQAVDSLSDAGVVVVCAAGNYGRSGLVTVTSPCNSRKAITVGASNDHNTADIADDNMATYSSRGPTAIDLVAKPDIVAPGNRIVSTLAPGSYYDTLFPDRRFAGDDAQPGVFEYTEMSGTSMSAPIVAGTVALMLEQDPSLNPATVKARLMLSARKPAFGSPFVFGAGLLDILGALRATGSVAASAKSPLITPDQSTGMIAVENTATLWGNDQFSIMNLWPNVVWADSTQFSQPVVWAAGELNPDGELNPEGEINPDAELHPEGELSPDAPFATVERLWSDTALWTRHVLSPEDSPLPVILPLSTGFQDP